MRGGEGEPAKSQKVSVCRTLVSDGWCVRVYLGLPTSGVCCLALAFVCLCYTPTPQVSKSDIHAGSQPLVSSALLTLEIRERVKKSAIWSVSQQRSQQVFHSFKPSAVESGSQPYPSTWLLTPYTAAKSSVQPVVSHPLSLPSSEAIKLLRHPVNSISQPFLHPPQVFIHQ